jgi:hypothetical protein
MKAEHRKELETNVLADRMGHLIQRMKHRPQRRVFLYLLAGVVVVVALFIFYNMRKTAAVEASQRWRQLEDGFKPYIDYLKAEDKDTNAGKAARFQYAWLKAWDEGLSALGSQPVVALAEFGDNLGGVGTLAFAEQTYKELSEECAGDPVWEPEALYALAVIEEARALRVKGRSEHLDRAKNLYRKLADNEKYKNSAHGKAARSRAKLLEEKGKEVAEFYANLEAGLDIERHFFEAEQTLKKHEPLSKKKK